MSRREILYRLMYQHFTPGMMRRVPLRFKRHIAISLGYQLVERISANDWLMNLLKVKPGELSPMSIEMFASCVGGSSIWPFFLPWTYWRWAGQILRRQPRTQAEELELKTLSTPPQIKYPPSEFPGLTKAPRPLPTNRGRVS